MSQTRRAVTSGNLSPIPDVSVIVINWNLKDYLRACLASISLFSGDLMVEIIVVDNASADGSAEMVEQEFPQVRLIRNSFNEGFSRANNQAIDVAGGRYFFLLNNDAQLREGALPGLVAYMDAHLDVAICGPRVVNDDDTLQVRSKGWYPSISGAFGHFFVPAVWRKRNGRIHGLYDFSDDHTVRAIDWVCGCALVARREAVDEVGLLDAEVFMYCEDVDWCFRMKRAGWKVMYNPSAVVMHHGGQSMKLQEGRVVGAHKQGLVAFYAKYHGVVATAFFRGILWIGYTVRVAGWIINAFRGRGEGLSKLRRMLRGKHSGAQR